MPTERSGDSIHVLLIHQAFAAPGEAGGTRHYELARHLVRMGHRVTVVASIISYLTGSNANLAPGGSDPLDEAAPIRVERVWVYRALHRSFVHRVLSFVSFMLSSFVRALRIKHVDVVWGTSPPIFQVLTAFTVAFLRQKPFVFEVRDLWPDFAIELGVLRNRPLIWVSRKLEHFLYRQSDRIVVNSPGFLPHLRRCDVPDDVVDLIPNGVELSDFDPTCKGRKIRHEFGLEGKFVVLYAGAHGVANDLGTVLLAAEALRNRLDIKIVLVGDGKERTNLIQRAEDMKLTNVDFVPAQPKERIAEFIAAADICLATLQPTPLFATTYPNKVFDYMAGGRPTLLAIDGVIREVVERADGGVYVIPGSPRSLVTGILKYDADRELCRRQGQSARRYVAQHFQRKTHASKLEAVLKSLVTSE